MTILCILSMMLNLSKTLIFKVGQILRDMGFLMFNI
jgi:hypothetical protein